VRHNPENGETLGGIPLYSPGMAWPRVFSKEQEEKIEEIKSSRCESCGDIDCRCDAWDEIDEKGELI
jgi:hypothetical protein